MLRKKKWIELNWGHSACVFQWFSASGHQDAGTISGMTCCASSTSLLLLPSLMALTRRALVSEMCSSMTWVEALSTCLCWPLRMAFLKWRATAGDTHLGGEDFDKQGSGFAASRTSSERTVQGHDRQPACYPTLAHSVRACQAYLVFFHAGNHWNRFLVRRGIDYSCSCVQGTLWGAVHGLLPQFYGPCGEMLERLCIDKKSVHDVSPGGWFYSYSQGAVHDPGVLQRQRTQQVHQPRWGCGLWCSCAGCNSHWWGVLGSAGFVAVGCDSTVYGPWDCGWCGWPSWLSENTTIPTKKAQTFTTYLCGQPAWCVDPSLWGRASHDQGQQLAWQVSTWMVFLQPLVVCHRSRSPMTSMPMAFWTSVPADQVHRQVQPDHHHKWEGPTLTVRNWPHGAGGWKVPCWGWTKQAENWSQEWPGELLASPCATPWMRRSWRTSLREVTKRRLSLQSRRHWTGWTENQLAEKEWVRGQGRRSSRGVVNPIMMRGLPGRRGRRHARSAACLVVEWVALPGGGAGTNCGRWWIKQLEQATPSAFWREYSVTAHGDYEQLRALTQQSDFWIQTFWAQPSTNQAFCSKRLLMHGTVSLLWIANLV